MRQREPCQAGAADRRDRAARTTPLGEVLTAAPDTDPAAAEVLAETSSNRMFGASVFVSRWAGLPSCLSGYGDVRLFAGQRRDRR